MMRTDLAKYIYAAAVIVILFTGESAPAQTQYNRPFDFQIWKIFSPDTKGFTIVVLSTNAEHFNRKDMTALAARLNEEFAGLQRLKVGLLDDANAAHLFVSGRLETSDFKRAQKGTYYHDRNMCREYVRFLTAGKRPKLVTIKFKCSRGSNPKVA